MGADSICEPFNGSLRRKYLAGHWFASLAEAQTERSRRRRQSARHGAPTTTTCDTIPVWGGNSRSLPSERDPPASIPSLKSECSAPDLLWGPTRSSPGRMDSLAPQR